MDQVNQVVNQATQTTIKSYESSRDGKGVSTSGSFPKFVSEHYHKNKGSTHGETMRNVSRQYKNTTFYK
jgi:hypothetical protein